MTFSNRAALLALSTTLLACAQTQGQATQGGFFTSSKVTGKSMDIRSAQADLFHGKKPRVAVMSFENRSGVYHFTGGKAVGDAMKEQLTSALMQTGAFVVLERDRINAAIGEQDFANGGRVRKGSRTALGEMEAADFQIHAVVSELMQGQAGASGGLNVNLGGLKFNPIDALSATMNQDYVVCDFRVVDVRTGQTVGTATVEGRARDLAGAVGGHFGPVLTSFSGNYSTPIQKAVRHCVVQAVDEIANGISDSGFLRATEAQWGEDERGDAADATTAAIRIPVATSGAKVRYQARAASIAIATLDAGTEVELLTEDGDWIQVRLSDGKTGWMARSDFGS